MSGGQVVIDATRDATTGLWGVTVYLDGEPLAWRSRFANRPHAEEWGWGQAAAAEAPGRDVLGDLRAALAEEGALLDEMEDMMLAQQTGSRNAKGGASGAAAS